MQIFIKTVRAMFKRPFIIVFCSIAVLLYYIIDYNMSRMLLLFIESEYSSIFDSIIHLLQLMFSVISDTKKLPSIALYVMAFAFLLSVPAGLVLSGYLNIINNMVSGRAKSKGEFLEGIKKHFMKTLFITFRALLVGIVFILFMLIASVPALIIIKSALLGKSELNIAAVLVGLLTGGVLFFCSIFFRTYVLFWYFAAVDGIEKPFFTGKKMADSGFWKLLIRFLVLDIGYILFFIISFKIPNHTMLFISNWIFMSFFFSFLITYIFAVFKIIRIRKKVR